MSITEEIRNYKTSDIYWHLENNQKFFDDEGIVVLCDELLRRKETIKHLKVRFEHLVRRLKDRTLKKIDQEEDFFSPATLKVVGIELNKRKLSRVQWFYSHDGTETNGPIDRDTLLIFLLEGKVKDEHFIWKQGTKDWVAVKNVPRLKEVLFFDQEYLNEKQEDSTTKPNEKPPPVFNENPIEVEAASYSIAAGILELLSIPFWIMGIIYSVFSSHNTELGFMIPLIFTIFATISAIPVGIGLLLKKKWAWSIKLFVATGAIFLILLKVVFDEVPFFWMIFAGFQALILLLIMNGRKGYDS